MMMIVLRVTDRQTDRVPCVMLSTLCLKKTQQLDDCAQNPLHTLPRNLDGEAANLLRTC